MEREHVAAGAAQHSYLQAHPQDGTMWDRDERLAMIKALREEERATAVPVSVSAAAPPVERKVA